MSPSIFLNTHFKLFFTFLLAHQVDELVLFFVFQFVIEKLAQYGFYNVLYLIANDI